VCVCVCVCVCVRCAGGGRGGGEVGVEGAYLRLSVNHSRIRTVPVMKKKIE
jgi:hypothetical protein